MENAVESFRHRYRPPEDIVRILTDNGDNINTQDNDGNTLLHIACLRVGLQGINLTTYLIDNGADVNIQNNDGNTPLHLACQRCNAPVSFPIDLSIHLIRQLLAVNADTSIRNNEGFTPIDIVRRLSTEYVSDEDKDMITIMLTQLQSNQIQNAVSVDALTASSQHEVEKPHYIDKPINIILANRGFREKIKSYLRPSPNTLRGLLGERVYDSYVDSARRFLYPYPYPQQTANAGVVATTERNKPSKGGKRKMKTMKRKMKKTMKRKM